MVALAFLISHIFITQIRCSGALVNGKTTVSDELVTNSNLVSGTSRIANWVGMYSDILGHIHVSPCFAQFNRP